MFCDMDNAFFMFNAPSKLGKPTNIAEHNKKKPENNLKSHFFFW